MLRILERKRLLKGLAEPTELSNQIDYIHKKYSDPIIKTPRYVNLRKRLDVASQKAFDKIDLGEKDVKYWKQQALSDNGYIDLKISQRRRMQSKEMRGYQFHKSTKHLYSFEDNVIYNTEEDPNFGKIKVTERIRDFNNISERRVVFDNPNTYVPVNKAKIVFKDYNIQGVEGSEALTLSLTNVSRNAQLFMEYMKAQIPPPIPTNPLAPTEPMVVNQIPDVTMEANTEEIAAHTENLNTNSLYIEDLGKKIELLVDTMNDGSLYANFGNVMGEIIKEILDDDKREYDDTVLQGVNKTIERLVLTVTKDHESIVELSESYKNMISAVIQGNHDAIGQNAQSITQAMRVITEEIKETSSNNAKAIYDLLEKSIPIYQQPNNPLGTTDLTGFMNHITELYNSFMQFSKENATTMIAILSEGNNTNNDKMIEMYRDIASKLSNISSNVVNNQQQTVEGINLLGSAIGDTKDTVIQGVNHLSDQQKMLEYLTNIGIQSTYLQNEQIYAKYMQIHNIDRNLTEQQNAMTSYINMLNMEGTQNWKNPSQMNIKDEFIEMMKFMHTITSQPSLDFIKEMGYNITFNMWLQRNSDEKYGRFFTRINNHSEVYYGKMRQYIATKNDLGVNAEVRGEVDVLVNRIMDG